MDFKVVVNYPTSEEGIQLLEDRQAAAVLKTLKDMLSGDELNELMVRIEERINREKNQYKRAN